jgi:Ca2+-binding EF-hand superfamily protein
MSEDKKPNGINAQEERELQRVFDHLSNYVPRTKVQRALAPKKDRRALIKAHKANPDSTKVFWETGDDKGTQMNEVEIDDEFESLTSEIQELERKISVLENPPSGVKKIRKPDLFEALKALGKTCTRKEIDDMIWEVDDNLDDAVDWEEFRIMFNRNITDQSGLEPCQLFNVVQFMTYDKNFSGTVTVDDTMSMLYARYGPTNLVTEMKKLFGAESSSADGGGSLTFIQYLKAVGKNASKPS